MEQASAGGREKGNRWGEMTDSNVSQSGPSERQREPFREQERRVQGAEGRSFPPVFVPLGESSLGAGTGASPREVPAPSPRTSPAPAASLTFLRGILGGGGASEGAWSPAPPAREAAAAAVVVPAGSVVTAVSPALCPRQPVARQPALRGRQQPPLPAGSLTLPPGHGSHPRHVTRTEPHASGRRHLGLGQVSGSTATTLQRPSWFGALPFPRGREAAVVLRTRRLTGPTEGVGGHLGFGQDVDP